MADSAEESSWTFYIQAFMCDDQNSSFSSDYEATPSLVSDAASSPVKKLTHNIHCTDSTLGFSEGAKGNNIGRNINIMCKQSSFKKQKTKDYDLEDTASSPANSPKISYMNQFMNHKEKGKIDVSEVKRNIFGKGGALNDHHVEMESNCTDLKKRICEY